MFVLTIIHNHRSPGCKPGAAVNERLYPALFINTLLIGLILALFVLF